MNGDGRLEQLRHAYSADKHDPDLVRRYVLPLYGERSFQDVPDCERLMAALAGRLIVPYSLVLFGALPRHA